MRVEKILFISFLYICIVYRHDASLYLIANNDFACALHFSL